MDRTNPEDDYTLDEIFDEITALGLQSIQPGEFSVSMLAKRRGLSYNGADRMIQEAVEAGRYEEVPCLRLVGGQKAKVYRKRRDLKNETP